MQKARRALVLGACGQVGLRLVEALQAHYGYACVWASDKRSWPSFASKAQFASVDVLDEASLSEAVRACQPTEVYHLASMLSAQGEAQPRSAWHLSIDGLLNVLNCAHQHSIRVFYPSSIAVCGPSSQRQAWPQQSYNDPCTIYGIAKQAGEALCAYYRKKYALDVRMIRYPGLVGGTPGGGVTDYACHLYEAALHKKNATCFIAPDTPLPLMAISDAIQGTLQLMNAPLAQLSVPMGYNLHAFSSTPQAIVRAIQAHSPSFSVRYQPDFRDEIAQTWPATIDDTPARRDWGWKPQYDLKGLTQHMLKGLQEPNLNTI